MPPLFAAALNTLELKETRRNIPRFFLDGVSQNGTVSSPISSERLGSDTDCIAVAGAVLPMQRCWVSGWMLDSIASSPPCAPKRTQPTISRYGLSRPPNFVGMDR